MKTGNGKIANLPSAIRDQLNYRIAEGEEGIELVEWLNSKPEVIKVIHERFDGTLISEQNLSQWRKRGYQKWLAFHNTIDETNALGDNAEVIAETGIDCDKLLITLTAAYAEAIQSWIITPGEQMTYKLAVYKNLTNGVITLRRAELLKVRLEIERERLELLREKRRNKSASSSIAPASSSGESASTSGTKPASQSECELPHSSPPKSDPGHADPQPAKSAQSELHSRPAIEGGVIQASPLPPSPPAPQPAAPILARSNPPGRVLSFRHRRIG